MCPCIVLGIETQIGLGIVRELGRAGVPVIGITHDRRAIGLASRFLTRGVFVSAPRSEELKAAIRQLGEHTGARCLIAVSEVNLSWLVANLGAFGRVTPVVPPKHALTIALDKKQTLAAAIAVGIPVPETVEPTSLLEAKRLASTFPFPAVLKWKDPAAVAGLLAAHGLELLKTEYVYSQEQFLIIAERFAPVGHWPLVQEYCAGRGLGQFFFLHQGEVLRRFQHIRVAEWPPEGGFSSVCDAVPLDQYVALQEKSIALLKSIGWDGVAMVEYRLDMVTGRAVLMEINGRYWGSFPLAVECGAGFALLAYMAQTTEEIPTLPPARVHLRCRMVATEIKRLIRIFVQPGKISDRSFTTRRTAELLRFFTDFFRPRVSYYVWAFSDPGPFFADLRNLLRKIVKV